MDAEMPARLRTFYEPQAEQLAVRLGALPLGLAGATESDDAEAWLWVAAVGEHCLVSAHGVRPKRAFDLVERPTAYACITSVSAATARECAPGAVPSRLSEDDNVLAFAQPEGDTVCRLEPGAVYAARNICLTPGFFADLARRHGKRFERLPERFDEADPDLLPTRLRAVLAAVGPEAATSPAAALLMEARVDEAVYLLAESLDEQERARQDDGARSQRDLVQRACRIVDADVAHVPSLEELARAVYASRARLCAAFKQETGMSVGEYARRRRMERACALLGEGRLSVAEVAHAVGYARPGSFTEAFERAVGMPPSAWRERAR